jgi:hypothetical protein
MKALMLLLIYQLKMEAMKLYVAFILYIYLWPQIIALAIIYSSTLLIMDLNRDCVAIFGIAENHD